MADYQAPSTLNRKFTHSVYRMISLSPLLAKLWLAGIGRVLSGVKNFRIKTRFVSNMRSYPWPDIRFSSRTVHIFNDLKIKLIPHTDSFDFFTLFNNKLNYEPEVFALLRKRIATYDVIIEIGANVGVFTMFFANELHRLKRDTPIYAFEPSNKAYIRLLQNLELNHSENVHPMNVAVFSKTGFIDFFEPEGCLTNGSVDANFAEIFSKNIRKSKVAAISESELIELAENQKSVFIKLDVEGAEAAIIKSMQNFIECKQPEMSIEVLKEYEHELNQLEFLKKMYDYYLMSADGLLPKTAFEANPENRDYLLIPKNKSI
ncbi:MAG: FkbM family methyltransferase [Gammaproteobacteria bacterium]|nr:FkbM family methyltransferase [Gammaproteobacteria bacterium]